MDVSYILYFLLYWKSNHEVIKLKVLKYIIHLVNYDGGRRDFFNKKNGRRDSFLYIKKIQHNKLCILY
jgi:hypothetical protein